MQAASESKWQNHQARNDSIIVDLFHGQLKSVIVCPKCKTTSITFDPFMILRHGFEDVVNNLHSLPLVRDQTGMSNVSLATCLGAFLQEEKLTPENPWFEIHKI